MPRDEAALRAYLSGERIELIELLPELATLRDVAFYVASSCVAWRIELADRSDALC